MKILGLDSSGLVASVAIIDENVTIAEYTVNYKKTHSQTLLPMLSEICNMLECDLEEIDAIAIAKGPGSFTGLRIGSATAKGLAMAGNKPIIEIPTVDGLAFSLYGVNKLICPIMDARRGQVYTGLYRFEDENGKSVFRTIKKQVPMEMQEMIAFLNERQEAVIFLGDGVDVYREMVEADLKVPFEFAPNSCNRQRASVVASLALDYYRNGCMVDAKDHKPDYLRLSQAERELLEKQKADK